MNLLLPVAWKEAESRSGDERLTASQKTKPLFNGVYQTMEILTLSLTAQLHPFRMAKCSLFPLT